MRITLHYGQGLASHNDRRFRGHADHINAEKSINNFCWQCYKHEHPGIPFEEAEYIFYENTFGEYISARNEKADKLRNARYATTTGQYLHGKKSQPEEVLIYLGDKETHASADTLLEVTKKYVAWHNKRFPQIKVLDVAMHVDEDGAPHVHLRQVYVAHDRDGRALVSKDRCLKEMGIDPPDPARPEGRNNNRKQTYTKACRDKLQALARDAGLEVETRPREASRSGRRLADYKAEQAHQKAERAIQAAEQAQKLLQETNAMLDRLGDAPALTEHILALEAYLDSYNVDNGRSMLEAFSEEEQHYNQEQTLDWEER